MQTMIQPEDGVTPIVGQSAAPGSPSTSSFRFDIDAVAEALTRAVGRGVAVRALIANANRGGNSKLRKLESSLLKLGVTLSRTADDMVRYHGKLLVIDRKRAHVLGFNYTRQDIEKSRSFGLVTENPKIVRDILSVIDADHNRVDPQVRSTCVVVSPEHARARPASFITRQEGAADLRHQRQRRCDDRVAEGGPRQA